jgi:hypothetical protein
MVDESAADLLGPGLARAAGVEVGDIGIGVMVHLDGEGLGFHLSRNPITRTFTRGMKRWPYSKKMLLA